MKCFPVFLLLFLPLSAGAEVHYVSPAGTPVFPYTNWVMAATNIQSAVDACVAGDEIQVTNGTYILSSEIVVDKAVRIESVNGPDNTIIDGGHSVRCLNLGSNACVVSGFTIRNGFYIYGYGGGVYCANDLAVVTNCVLQGNLADSGGGGMSGGIARNCRFIDNYGGSWGGGGMQGGTARDCDFTGNQGDAYGGALYESFAIGCTISNNSAASGAGLAYGDARDCAFISNTADHDGGGMYMGAASNCVLRNNHADYGGGLANGSAVDCILMNNYSDANMSETTGGGGAYDSALTNCLIKDNHAYWDGGGMLGGTAVGCTIEGNTASQSGGGGYGIAAINCLVQGNFNDLHGDGSGLADSVAYNCTIVDNHSAYLNGVAMVGAAYNCIIYNNTNDDDSPADSGGALVNTCCPTTVPGVNGNITNAPMFGANHHLSSNSPCINWGNNVYVSEAKDLDGNPRIVEGYIDMGCFEYQSLLGLSDSDGDGLLDEWEQLYFGGNADPFRDDDDDGQSNGAEQVADSVPTNGASYFRITYFNPMEITWQPCASNRQYSIWWSTNLMVGFFPVTEGLSYPQNSYTDAMHAAVQQGYYRVGVEMQTE